MASSGDVAPFGAAGGDRCANCQAPLASDQRYCVSCGVRRGKSRYSLEAMAAQAAPPPAPAPAPRRARSRASSGVTLVTGVATLLLAMGVGVLIGHDSSSSSPQKEAAAQVITVNGGGTASGSTAANSGAKTTSKTKNKTAKQLGIKPTVVKLNKKTVQAASSAATKVFGQSGNRAPPTVQVGQACSHGAGCQGGKFTGNFFH